MSIVREGYLAELRTGTSHVTAITGSLRRLLRHDWQFATDRTYELPFALPHSPQSYAGVAQIRGRFEAVATSPVGRLLKIQTLSATVHAGDDPAVSVVEFTATGTQRESGAAFSVVTSIAVIRCEAGRVVQYRDYPNTLGIAAAGVLQQFAASLK